MSARGAAGWSVGMLVVATAAALTATSTSTVGSAATLDVDGGVLQFFRLAGPDLAAAGALLGGIEAGTAAPEPPAAQTGGADLVATALPPMVAPTTPDPTTAPSTPPAVPSSAVPNSPASPITPAVPVTPARSAPATDSTAPVAPTTVPSPAPSSPAPGTSPVDAAAAPTEPRPAAYEDCAAFREVRDAELDPLTLDDPAYRVDLDADGDGVACTDADLVAEQAAVTAGPTADVGTTTG